MNICLIILAVFGILLILSIIVMTCIVLSTEDDDYYYDSNFANIEDYKTEELEDASDR